MPSQPSECQLRAISRLASMTLSIGIRTRWLAATDGPSVALSVGAPQRCIAGNDLRSLRIVGKPFSPLDDFIDAALINAELEGDLLLRHAGRPVQVQNLLGHFGCHLSPDDPAHWSDSPLASVALPQFFQHCKRHAHPLLSESLFEFLECRHRLVLFPAAHLHNAASGEQ